MKLTDRRLYQARTLQDFRFRLFYEENHRSQESLQRAVASALLEPNYFLAWGTDHSDWDGNVDFKVTRGLGSRYVFIKAMEGTVPSRFYIPNTLRAKEAGLLDAPYHWLHQNSKVSCKLQAQQVWERTKPYVTKLPLMVDFEWTRYMGQPANPTYADLDIWVTEYTRISGIKPLYYSAAGYMNELGRMPADLRRKFIGFVVASYGGSGLPSMPIAFGPMDWEFHQFAATGNAAIISPNDAGKKEVDLLYSSLRPIDFDQKYGTSGQQPSPPDEEPMPPTLALYGIATGSITVRTGPNILFPKYQHNGTDLYVLAGDKLEATETANGFWKLFKITRLDGTAITFSADAWCGARYIDPIDPPAPPPSARVVRKAIVHFSDGTTQELFPSAQ